MSSRLGPVLIQLSLICRQCNIMNKPNKFWYSFSCVFGANTIFIIWWSSMNLLHHIYGSICFSHSDQLDLRRKYVTNLLSALVCMCVCVPVCLLCAHRSYNALCVNIFANPITIRYDFWWDPLISQLKQYNLQSVFVRIGWQSSETDFYSFQYCIRHQLIANCWFINVPLNLPMLRLVYQFLISFENAMNQWVTQMRHNVERFAFFVFSWNFFFVWVFFSLFQVDWIYFDGSK